MVCPRRDSGSDEAGAKKGSFANDVQKIQSKPTAWGAALTLKKLTEPEPRQKTMMPSYENSPLRQVTGDTLRPGGTRLTLRGIGLCEFRTGARLLDIGCGAGASLCLLREMQFSALGIDISPALLGESCEYSPVARADMEFLPFRDACLDGILCECTLSLADDPAAVLDECRRTLVSGGRLLLSDLVQRGPSSRRLAPSPEAGKDSLFLSVPCAQGALPVDELAQLIRERGFRVLHVEDHTRLLKELAVQIIWQFGSLAAFSELWRKNSENTPHLEPCACAPGDNPGKHLGYALVIAEKKENS